MKKIVRLDETLSSFEKKVIPILESLNNKAEKVIKCTPQIRNSWSGSWIGYHHKLYYGNFEKPPIDEKFSVEWGGINGFSDRWQERDPEEVKNYLEILSGISIDEIEREYKSLIHIVDDFYDATSIIIKTDKDMQEEISKENLLDGHKKLVQGEEGKLYLKAQMPATLMTRDSDAMTEGVFTPSILYYESFTYEIQKNVDLIYKNIKSIHHFIGWMKEKYSSSEEIKAVQASSTSQYVREEIIETIKNKKDGFNYTKLLKLITELNKNYSYANAYSCLSLIRAITDHIPPLLGYTSFEELVNNYKGAKTNKNFISKLFNNRDVSDDSLHTVISKATDLIDMDNVPNSLLLNRLLQECLDNTVQGGFKHSKLQKQLSQERKTPTIDPSLRPVLSAEITSMSSSPNGYFAAFSMINVGKGLAIIESVTLGDTTIPLRKPTLSENEKCRGVSPNLEDTRLRKGEIKEPKLVITYTNINNEKFTTTYDIVLERRNDQEFNIGSFTNPKFGV